MRDLIRRLIPFLLMLSLLLASHGGMELAFSQGVHAATLNHCALPTDQGDESFPDKKNHKSCVTCQICSPYFSFPPSLQSFEAFVATPVTRSGQPPSARIDVAQPSTNGRQARAPPVSA
jgi:hypothetical protein